MQKEIGRMNSYHLKFRNLFSLPGSININTGITIGLFLDGRSGSDVFINQVAFMNAVRTFWIFSRNPGIYKLRRILKMSN